MDKSTRAIIGTLAIAGAIGAVNLTQQAIEGARAFQELKRSEAYPSITNRLQTATGVQNPVQGPRTALGGAPVPPPDARPSTVGGAITESILSLFSGWDDPTTYSFFSAPS